jgi:hypothetical protein
MVVISAVDRIIQSEGVGEGQEIGDGGSGFVGDSGTEVRAGKVTRGERIGGRSIDEIESKEGRTNEVIVVICFRGSE